MSVKPMLRLSAIVPREAADTLIRRLMRLRCVSIDRAEHEAGAPPTVSDAAIEAARTRHTRAEEAARHLAPYSKRKKSLFVQRTAVVMDEFRRDGRYDVAVKIVEETHKTIARQNELKKSMESEQERARALLPWFEYAQPLTYKGTETVRVHIGCFAAGTSAATIAAVLEPHLADYRELYRDRTGVFAVVMAHRSEDESVMSALAAAGFTPAPVEGLCGTAKSEYDEAERRLRELSLQLQKCEQNLAVLATGLTEVEILCDLEKNTLLAEENKQQLQSTDSCTVLTGWCPADSRARVEEALVALGAAFEFSPPKEGDDVPVLLDNNRFAASFEWVIGMYAYPKYGSFDPTMIMGIFYLIIFGLMFADAGYGLVLCIACFGAVRWLHPAEGLRRVLMMFGYCGISCIVMGVLFGAYFGNFPLAFMEHTLGMAPEALPRLSLLPAEAANLAVWFDPLLNPMGFLIVSLGIGAVHLVAGMAVQFYVLCRRGQAIDALCDIATWWLVFAGLGCLFISKTLGMWLALSGVAGIVLTHGRAKKSLPARLLSGLLGLYDGINYAADLLSYSRILALGLAAGVIAQVVNILATMGGASFIGILMMIVVFIIGHVLNLAINVLGSFVHAARLQYIEFFGKFFEDGGTPFRPMATSDRYTVEAASFGAKENN